MAFSAFVGSRRRPMAGWFAKLALALVAIGSTQLALAQSSFVNFESGQVRPMALSPEGARLFVVNTPDNRLEVFNVTPAELIHVASVPVGMEPVAVAVRSATEVWVVNHLSDSISIVDLSAADRIPRVVDTLLVGDEPRDIVFAGPNGDRAFITTAHRGQHSPFPFDSLLSEGRTDVWVFDANDRSAPLTVLQMFGDTPRPLAVSPDGNTVYAGVFYSGNRTSVLHRDSVLGEIGDPDTNVDGVPAPIDIGMIVQADDQNRWFDGNGMEWTPAVRMSLPDYDVFVIDAAAETPVEVDRISGVGTTLFNMAVSPTGGELFVSNLDARNIVRFEGVGDFAPSTVRGHFIENRITVVDLDSGNAVMPRHLNKHIDYDRFLGTPEENDASLATPLEMVFNPAGDQLYVAAYGSSKVGVFDTGELIDDSFTPDPASHIELSGGGPSGLVLDSDRDRLYVLTRFNNSISVVDLDSQAEIDVVPMFSPEPPVVTDGRRFLYDARFTSSRGDSSCAGCHIFGDVDHLAWDLGDPDGSVLENLNPLFLELPPGFPRDFHPMKGPMTTQSFRGMTNHGPMHWRGDRSGANDPEIGDAFDTQAAFRAFNGAFKGLIGREDVLSDEEMQAFAEFALTIHYPPNPVRNLNNQLTPVQQRGFDAYNTVPSDQDQTCNACHVVDVVAGRFGTNGFTVIRRNAGVVRQPLKIPHIRNMYTKVGFFGRSRGFDDEGLPVLGDQVRGFGFTHDGAWDTMFNFLQDFTLESDVQRREVVDFLMASDAEMLPVVGQQVTLAQGNIQQVRGQLVTLLQQSGVTSPRPACDLIVKGIWGGAPRGAVRQANGQFRTDREGDSPLSIRALLQISQRPGQSLTFTCVPPGSGERMGIDRNEDGVLDGDDID
ncbi:MAG: hypothetical protein AAF184_03015 [Pseudomonadota bacterium]